MRACVCALGWCVGRSTTPYHSALPGWEGRDGLAPRTSGGCAWDGASRDMRRRAVSDRARARRSRCRWAETRAAGARRDGLRTALCQPGYPARVASARYGRRGCRRAGERGANTQAPEVIGEIADGGDRALASPVCLECAFCILIPDSWHWQVTARLQTGQRPPALPARYKSMCSFALFPLGPPSPPPALPRAHTAQRRLRPPHHTTSLPPSTTDCVLIHPGCAQADPLCPPRLPC